MMQEIIDQRNAIAQKLSREGYEVRQFTNSEMGLFIRAIGDERGPYTLVVWERHGWTIRCYGASDSINPATMHRHCAAALETRTT
jgi:hypothetical protein